VRISVALCTRDGLPFVREQVASVLAQTRPADQLVVSDDASSDDTVRVVEAAVGAAGDAAPALVVLRNDPPLGVTRNFEQALLATDGDLLVLCDQDDVWEPDRLARLEERFRVEPGLDALFGDAVIVDGDGNPTGATLFGMVEVGGDELAAVESGAAAFEVFLHRNLATGATMALRRRLLDRAVPFPAHWVHDEWLAMLAAADGRLGVERRPLVRYRIHGGNTIGVVEPTLRRKIARVLERRGDRNRVLAHRGAELAAYLRSHRAPERVVALSRSKALFELRRARLPRVRLLRVGPVLILAARGDYHRFASQGPLDIVRDLLQPA